LGVRAELYEQWTRDGTQSVNGVEERAQGLTAKAWRFEPEMREISATFESAGMPPEFHQAAAEIYRRLAPLKERADRVELQDVLEALGEPGERK
jgi:hypothetical protein